MEIPRAQQTNDSRQTNIQFILNKHYSFVERKKSPKCRIIPNVIAAFWQFPLAGNNNNHRRQPSKSPLPAAVATNNTHTHTRTNRHHRLTSKRPIVLLARTRRTSVANDSFTCALERTFFSYKYVSLLTHISQYRISIVRKRIRTTSLSNKPKTTKTLLCDLIHFFSANTNLVLCATIDFFNVKNS